MTRPIRFLLFISALVCVLASCRSRVSTPDELISFVSDPDNGLSKQTEVNGIRVEVVNRPTDLLVYQDLSGIKNNSSHIIDSLKSSYSNKTFFILSFSSNNREIETRFASTPADYSAIIQYLSSGIGSDIVLRDEKSNKIPLLNHAYIRMYGTTGKSSLLLVFDREEVMKAEKIVLEINDQSLGAGRIAFDFNTKDLKSIPALELKCNNNFNCC